MTDKIDTSREATNSEKRKAVCSLCGEPMPPGEEMFKYHGYSGDCPKSPLPKTKEELETVESLRAERDIALARAERAEAALEVARIDGCRMGLAAVAITAFGWDNYAVASRAINALDPARIVKESWK